MTAIPADLSEMMRTTEESLRRYAATPSALETVLKSQRERVASAAATATSGPLQGMSKGKIAAVVAGVAVAGGALYALSRKKKDPDVGPWTNRIEAERAAAASSNLQR